MRNQQKAIKTNQKPIINQSEFMINNQNQRYKGWNCLDKTDCTQDGHDSKDHCAKHCMCTVILLLEVEVVDGG